MAMHVSTKRLQISKANTTIVVAVGVAAFTLAFSLVASRSLLAKQSYQNRVVAAREKARDQLDKNIVAVDELKIKYEAFIDRQENIIKGSSTGDGERDGDNARIVLDALPSKYDFPGLASSLEKVLEDGNYTITNLTGTDEEASRNASENEGLAGTSGSVPEGIDPEILAQFGGEALGAEEATGAVEMPFELSVESDFQGSIRLLQTYGRSIRPISIRTATLSAGEGSVIELSISGYSYFQPERTLNVTEEVVE